ncbi:glutathione peroxidase [Bosea sp. OAE752]|uniref:glutathione peroxidase n=1 Tax=unclassified Bosea (in: a-proteobacteria) TaxID=2653178 RepID=UPI000DDF8C8D
MDRRTLIAGLGALAALPGRAAAQAADAYAFGFDRPGSGRLALSDYRGRPILVVNTATRCGYAGQMATLEQLWQRYQPRGLMLVAVPSNDFGGQEPLDGAAIAEAARESYGATYAFVEKTVVKGPQAHPFYRWAAAQKPAETPRWNFHKYLIGSHGELVGGYPAGTDPLSPQLVRAIGQELQAG